MRSRSCSRNVGVNVQRESMVKPPGMNLFLLWPQFRQPAPPVQQIPLMCWSSVGAVRWQLSGAITAVLTKLF